MTTLALVEHDPPPPTSFKTRLLTEYLDGFNFILAEPFEFFHDTGFGRIVITVPAGTETDFASVPRIFWRLCPPHGLYGKAAVVHDYCYRTKVERVSRHMADLMFLEGMKVLGVPAWKRWAMYLAVRCFGRRAFVKKG